MSSKLLPRPGKLSGRASELTPVVSKEIQEIVHDAGIDHRSIVAPVAPQIQIGKAEHRVVFSDRTSSGESRATSAMDTASFGGGSMPEVSHLGWGVWYTKVAVKNLLIDREISLWSSIIIKEAENLAASIGALPMLKQAFSILAADDPQTNSIPIATLEFFQTLIYYLLLFPYSKPLTWFCFQQLFTFKSPQNSNILGLKIFDQLLTQLGPYIVHHFFLAADDDKGGGGIRLELILFKLEVLDHKAREKAGLMAPILGSPVPVLLQFESVFEESSTEAFL